MNRTTQIALAHWANLYSQNEFLPSRLENKNTTSVIRKANVPEEIVITLKYNDKIIKMLPPVDPNILSGLVQDALENNETGSRAAVRAKTASKIVINTLDRVHVINIADIIYCESDKGYTTFYLTNKEKVIASKILSKYEAVLPSTQFMRIHQSFLVNLEHILCYEKKDKNCVITTNNHEIPVSHRLKSKLIDYFEGLG